MQSATQELEYLNVELFTKLMFYPN